MGEKMVIVGAGISGLSTGFYARLNGFETTIFEADTGPGGLCAAWTRKGYTFDTSMHLVTSSKEGPFREMWEELGVVGDREFHYHSSLYAIEGRTKHLDFSTDAKLLLPALIELSPEDRALSEEFVGLFCGPDMMSASSLKPNELFGPLDYLRMGGAILPMMKTFRKYGNTTVQDFASRFHDPFLRDAIRFTVDSPGWPMPRFPLSILSGFAKSSVSNAGVPIGGSNRAMHDLAARYERLGGIVKYRTRVRELLIEKDRVIGVRLEDGSEIRADIVVWAADGHHLIFDLLDGRYVDERIRKMYSEWVPVQPLLQVLLGVNRDMSAEPARLLRELAEPIVVAGNEHRWISVVNLGFDPTSAPKGKTALEVWFPTSYDYWAQLGKERKRYLAEKEEIAERTISVLEERWPGLRSQIELVDVATPATYVRYTGNWRGSPDGWYVTVENFMDRSVLRSLPGLEGLYTVGQWTAPYTGTVIAATTGRQLVELLCHQMHRPFTTCPSSRAAAV
jgi:phytoene dehydrogenase-like protein